MHKKEEKANTDLIDQNEELEKHVSYFKNFLTEGRKFYYARHGQTTFNEKEIESGWGRCSAY